MTDVNGFDGWVPQRTGPWIALDCGVLRGKRLRGLPAAAKLLYVACALHCGDELTDGFVADDALPQVFLEAGAGPDDMHALQAKGLARRDESQDGWVLPDFLDWNPPRAWWEHKRDNARERQNRHREKNRAANAERARRMADALAAQLGDGR